MAVMSNLQEFANDVLRHGPSRVLISKDEVVPYHRAMDQFNIYPEVIFIRNDGWSLGTPRSLEKYAEQFYEDMWIGVIRLPDMKPIPYLRIKK